MDIYGAVVETLILIFVAAECFFSWQYLQEKRKQTIKRAVSRALKQIFKSGSLTR